MKTFPVLVVLLLVPSLLLAQDARNYSCTLDEVTRRVEIFSEPGVTVPCEVHYYKDTEAPGDRQVLWRAANEEGYCEAQAAAFIQKLESMGWTCWAGAQPAAEPAAEPAGEPGDEADDTDALAPAEEEIEIPESDTPG